MIRMHRRLVKVIGNFCAATGFLLMGAVILAGSPCRAANWRGYVNSSWVNSSNWQNGITPTSSDHAYIYLTTHNPEIATGSNECKNIYLPAGWLEAGSASLTVSGGTLIAQNIYCGSESETAHVGTLTVSNGEVSVTYTLYVGHTGGSGTLNVSGGNITCGALNVAVNSSASGTASITGGQLTCTTLKIGENGLLNIAGGQLTITDLSARMAIRLLMDQNKVVGYGGQGRVLFGSSGTALVLTAELTDDLAQAPDPADLSTQVASGISRQLSWTAGNDAVSHNVYFSADADAVTAGDSTAFQGNQTGTTFETPDLETDTVYYWRVDELTGSVTNGGDIWSFRTDDPDRQRPLIGVIRWDMYSGMGATQEQELGYISGGTGYLAPTNWNWRAPFFCWYTSDVTWETHAQDAGPLWFNYPNDFWLTRQATEEEIAFAGTAGAGLDYWIFGTAPASAGGNGWGLTWNLDAFLESERRLEINYAMMFRMDAVSSWTGLDSAIEELVWHAKQPNYQTVLFGRPLVYFLNYKECSVFLGDPADGTTVSNLANAVQEVRIAFLEAGLPDPYLVATATPAHVRNDGNWVDGGGFDAASDYRGAYGGTAEITPFDEMPDNLEPYWNLNSTNLAAAFVPSAPCGADSRPRFEQGTGGEYFYAEPEPGDLTALMNRVMNYITENPEECEADTFTMYAWNEHSEGGFLCPLIGESPDYIPDTRRLDEVGHAVNYYASGTEPVMVLVRADGEVYCSRTNSLVPVFALDLTAGTVVAAAADAGFVYGLTSSGDVIRADLNTRALQSEMIGTYSGLSEMPIGIDVKDGAVYAVTDSGYVYRNFDSEPLVTLSGSGFKDIAAKSGTAFRGLYGQNGSYVWTRDQDNVYVNFSNNGGAIAITGEGGSGYYVLRDDGLVYGPDNGSTYRGSWGADAVDLSVLNLTDLYTISATGTVCRSLNGGSVTSMGVVDPGTSEFVAMDFTGVCVENSTYIWETEPTLVFVRSDGIVYCSQTNTFNPVFALDLADETLVAAAADADFVYGLLEDGDVVRVDLNSTVLRAETIGTYSGLSGTLTGMDVKNGSVYVIDSSGNVYVNFDSVPDITLSNSGFVDIAAQSDGVFQGLCHNGGNYTWGRDQDNVFWNFSNNGSAVAITSEAGSGYYALRNDGRILNSFESSVGYIGTSAADITLLGSNVFYAVGSTGTVTRVLSGGSAAAFGTATASDSEFVSVDSVEISCLGGDYAWEKAATLVFVNEDGSVYISGETPFSPEFALDITSGSNTIISAAADDRYVYGLLNNGDVVRVDLFASDWFTKQIIGSYAAVSGTLTGIDVKNGTVYVIDSVGKVYKDFSSVPEITLSGTGFVDLAARSDSLFCGLYNNGGVYAWSRNQDDEYNNFGNAGGAVAITSEENIGYYVLRDDGYAYGPNNYTTYQGYWGTDAVDFTICNNRVLYSISDTGCIKKKVLLSGSGVVTVGTVDSGMSGFVAIDWLSQ